MKKLLSLVLSSVILLSCAKQKEGCKNVDPKDEETQLLAFATQNGYAVTKHSSGIYYQIVNPGSGVTPTATSRVYVIYTGKLMNGTIFDQASSPSSSGLMMSNLIEGWKIGLPLIKKGGTIRLLIPSAYAYGCTGSGGGAIAANSPLFFEIGLVDVQ